VNRFIQILRDSGFRQFYLSFGDANFRVQDWPAGAENLSGPLLDLARLFLLQEPVPEKRALALLGAEFLKELIQCGILRRQAGQLVSNSFYLLHCRSQAFFCQMNSNPVAYFGEDSVALATLQTPAPGGSVLDLCCGPGLQSFVAAGSAAKVTGVEIRKETWRIAELNRQLNGLDGRVRLVCDSAEGFARAGKEKYDRILFNPPLVPMVPGYKYSAVGNGGPDGLNLTRRILDLYCGRISATGSIEFIGVGLGRKGRPVVADEITAIARRHGLGARIHLLSRHAIQPSAPLFELSVLGLAKENGLEAEAARKILGDHFAGLGMDSYWVFFAALGHARAARGKVSSIIDLSASFWGNWFV
jgi:release factor glutamine methyltransferase